MAAHGAQIDEWQVPWDGTRPRDPDIAPDGSVWFVGQAGDYVARLDPDSGEFRRFDFMSPWEGADYVLPGDEKADDAAKGGR